ncbi:MAG: hypothetical protein HKN03_12660 [Acidimicrobiales bacterium]|nr:hypothetical protein [Acidimicrobiales bacterium]
MSSATMDLLRYGLYALTVLLGIALLLWVRKTQQDQRQIQVTRSTRSGVTGARPPTITAIRGLPSKRPMAAALEGIRLPAHWQPDPPSQVGNPVLLTTNVETPEEMAQLLSDELVRLGYTLIGMGANAARAVKDSDCLTLEVEAHEDGTFVSTRIALTDAGRG